MGHFRVPVVYPFGSGVLAVGSAPGLSRQGRTPPRATGGGGAGRPGRRSPPPPALTRPPPCPRPAAPPPATDPRPPVPHPDDLIPSAPTLLRVGCGCLTLAGAALGAVSVALLLFPVHLTRGPRRDLSRRPPGRARPAGGRPPPRAHPPPRPHPAGRAGGPPPRPRAAGAGLT